MRRTVWLITFAATALTVVILTVVWRTRADTRAAQQIAALEPEGAQRRLWQRAADEGAVPGLAGLGQSGVQPRPSQAPTPSSPVQSRGVVIPQGVTTGVEVVSTSNLDTKDLKATVVVEQADGEQLTLRVGTQGVMTLQVRVNGAPLPIGVNGQLDIRYDVRDDGMSRPETIGVKTAPGQPDNGVGVIRISERRDQPVSVTDTLFNLRAVQVDSTGLVDVRVGQSAPVRMSPGPARLVGTMMVAVLAVGDARAPQTGQREGRPYALSLLAWRSTP